MTRFLWTVALAGVFWLAGGASASAANYPVDGTTYTKLKDAVDAAVLAGLDANITLSLPAGSNMVNNPASPPTSYYDFTGTPIGIVNITGFTGSADGRFAIGFTNAAADARVLAFNQNTTIYLNNLDISGGNVHRSSGLTPGGGTGGAAIYVANDIDTFSGMTLTNLKIHQNNVLVDQAGAFIAGGGGVLIDARTTGGAPAGTVVFTDVELSGNTARRETAAGDTASNASGGGARLVNISSLAYNGGSVIGNSAELQYGSHAVGGGLDIEADDTATAGINGTVIRGNRAVVENDNTASHASGGGVYFYGGGATGTLTANVANVTFSGNSVTATNGTARGGASHSEGNVSATFTNNQFSGNTASAGLGTAQGGAISANSGSANTLTLSGNTFTGNAASAMTAQGGAVYSNSAASLSGDTFTSNSVSSNYGGGSAGGGAVYLGATGNAISGATFTGNTALGNSGTATADGGALFLDQGTTTITNSTFTGNRSRSGSGSNARGGAIFVNTGSALGVESIVNLVANGGDVTISGNTADGYASGIHYASASGTYLSNARLNIQAVNGGAVYLLDPVKVDIGNYNFVMEKSGAGDFHWDGANTFDAASTTVTLNGGTIHLGDKFTARATRSTGSYTVDLGSNTDYVFSASRSAGLAMFDFRDVTTANMIVGSGVSVGTDLDRQVLSINNVEYTIATGLSDAQAKDVAGRLNAAGLVESITYGTGYKVGNVYANVNYVSPYDHAGYNANQVKDVIQSMALEKDKQGNYVLTADQVAALRDNPWGVTPELFMSSGNIMIASVDNISRLAVDYGLVQPVRITSRQNSMIPSSSRAYVGDNHYYEAEEGYLCAPEVRGARVWAGYVGDFNSLDATSSFDGYDADRNGFLIGVNYDFGDAASVGVYGGYTRGEYYAKRASSQNKSNNGHFGAIARVSPSSQINIYADFGYHFSSNDTYRNLGFYHTEGSFDQDLWTAGLAAEYVMEMGGFNIVPQAKARYTHLYQGKLNETGLTASKIDSYNKGAFNTRLGVEASKDFEFDSGVFSPVVNVAWKHDYGNRSFDSSAYYFDVPSYQYNLSSARIDRDSVDLGVALRTAFEMGDARRVGLNVGYNYNVSRHSDTHTVYAGMEFGF